MNKYLTGLVVLCALPMSAMAEEDFSTWARTQSVKSNDLSVFDDRVPLSEKLLREYKQETPNVVYRDRKTDERVGKWYAGLRGDLSFLTWKNKYSGGAFPDDSFSFKPVFGLDLSVGYRFNNKWRVDGELGYVGEYSEKETEYYGSPKKTEFSLESYYMTANAYYDLKYGLYVGAGLGLAITDLSADDTEASAVSKTSVSPMGAAMFGWTYMLDEKIDFDVRYRFAMFNGGDLNIGGVDVDTGIVLNNSVGVGIRYHF